jgi:hypothetical protein
LSYHFGVTVNASELQALVDEGWVRGGQGILDLGDASEEIGRESVIRVINFFFLHEGDCARYRETAQKRGVRMRLLTAFYGFFAR